MAPFPPTEITAKCRRELLPSTWLLGKCCNKWVALTTLTPHSGHKSWKITNKSNFPLLYFNLPNEASHYSWDTALLFLWGDTPQQSNGSQWTPPPQSKRSWMRNPGRRQMFGTPHFPWDMEGASHLHGVARATLVLLTARRRFGACHCCLVTWFYSDFSVFKKKQNKEHALTVLLTPCICGTRQVSLCHPPAHPGWWAMVSTSTLQQGRWSRSRWLWWGRSCREALPGNIPSPTSELLLALPSRSQALEEPWAQQHPGVSPDSGIPARPLRVPGCKELLHPQQTNTGTICNRPAPSIKGCLFSLI